MTRPLVSVLIPCFNAAKYIGEALDSVFRQTWPNIEVVVVDDGSQDDSVREVKRFRDSRLRLVRQANRGAAAARNSGLRSAEGRWCVFLDADDYFDRDFLSVQANTADTRGVDICFGKFRLEWASGRRQSGRGVHDNATIDEALALVLSSGFVPPCGILWRSDFVRSIGAWDESLQGLNDDGELIARALLKQTLIASSSGAEAVYRQYDSPARVSAQRSFAAFASRFDVSCRVRHALENRPELKLARRALCRQMLEDADEVFARGYFELGREILAASKQLGREKRPGSSLHRLGCALLGPEAKARLSRALLRLDDPVA